MKTRLILITILLLSSAAFGQTTDQQIFNELTLLFKDATSDFTPIRGRVLSQDDEKIVYEPTAKYFQASGMSSKINYYIKTRLYEFVSTGSGVSPQNALLVVKSVFDHLSKKGTVSAKRISNVYYNEEFALNSEVVARLTDGGTNIELRLFASPPSWSRLEAAIRSSSWAAIPKATEESKRIDLSTKPTSDPNSSDFTFDFTFPDFQKLADEFKKNIANSEDFDQLLKKCESEIRKDDFSNAVETCSQAIKSKPDDSAPYRLRSIAYFYVADEKPKSAAEAITTYGNSLKTLAVNDLTKCTQLDPKHHDCFYLLGRFQIALEESEQINKAADNLTEAIRLGSEREDIYFIRAQANRFYNNPSDSFDDKKSALLVKRKELAVADYTRYLAAHPNDLDCYLGRGLLYNELEKYSLAIPDLSKVAEKVTDNEEVFFERGKAYAALKKYEAAIADFTKALDIHDEDPGFDPFPGEVMFERASAYKQLGKKTEWCRDRKTNDLDFDCEKEWKKK